MKKKRGVAFSGLLKEKQGYRKRIYCRTRDYSIVQCQLTICDKAFSSLACCQRQKK